MMLHTIFRYYPEKKIAESTHENSLRTMQNATTPDAVRKKTVCRALKPTKNGLLNKTDQSSLIKLIIARVMPITGASQYIVAAGLSMPISLFFNKSWVRAHRKPPRPLAVSTRRNPRNIKSVSVATMRRTPENIRKMTATSRIENFSSRNRKANKRTKISDEDLTIAEHDKIQGSRRRPKHADALKKDNEIVCRDRFERPMSSPVATAVGTAFFLNDISLVC